MNRCGIAAIMVIALSSVSCARKTVITSYGYRGKVKMGMAERPDRPGFIVKQRMRYFFNWSEDKRIEARKYLDTLNTARKDIRQFSITTTFTPLDVFLNILPFYHSRTIIYQGIYEKGQGRL